MSFTISHDPDQGEFYLDDSGVKAFLAYRKLEGKTLDLYHTSVPPALEGQGIAAALTEHALQFAKDNGYSVQPTCAYVQKYLQDHPQ